MSKLTRNKFHENKVRLRLSSGNIQQKRKTVQAYLIQIITNFVRILKYFSRYNVWRQ